MSDDRRATEAIEALHHFFVDWFNGTVPRDEHDFDRRLRRRLDASFVLISPDGERLPRAALLESLWSGHGKSEGFRITIDGVRLHHRVGDVVIATYREHQVGARNASRPTNARLSTVAFRDDGEQLTWLHVHETWLEPEQAR